MVFYAIGKQFLSSLKLDTPLKLDRIAKNHKLVRTEDKSVFKILSNIRD